MSIRMTKGSFFGGILGMAALLAPQGHAYSFCPTSNANSTITCTWCTVELTCDLNNVTIFINGDHVDFNGQYHSVSNGHILNQGSNNSISYVYVYFGGIWTGSDTRLVQDYTWISDVGVYKSQWVGISNDIGINNSHADLMINNSWVYSSGSGVSPHSPGQTNLYNSTLCDNERAYFNANAANSANSNVAQNYISGNRTGITLYDATGIYIGGNIIDNSSLAVTASGLYISGGANNEVRFNQGHHNSGHDCAVVNSPGTYGQENTWESYSGACNGW